MYADRYARSGGIQPGSLAIALGLNAAVVAALVLSSPAVQEKLRDPVLTTRNIPIEDPPPPIPQPKPQPHQKAILQQRQPIETVDRIVKTDAGDGPILPPTPPFDPGPPSGLDGVGTGPGPITPPLPALIAASVDPRFAADFQPDYPAAERRLEREGVVKIRVLIGVDGRVKAAQQIAATSDAFWRAAERQALSRWRFKPATRGGVAEESWRTMSLTFVLRD
ncbi:Protein TonB [Sphingomonas sp. EC-HK361]|uniref:energy transducer TonB n=1 Tax=Sphingomonas sp. EC-HK361 TaxID=2038397 RepID=UPI00125197EB|nr:energy transducer TonB [Sphingomonas sp. EC-HK361]VVS97890.1 Protein TonB [Sphingomonas sp. EC-HK361]